MVGWKTLVSPRGTLFSDSTTLEVTWTIIPIGILLRIASPSIYLLCLQDARNQSPTETIKIIRNQWNWQRETTETVDHLLDSERTELITAYERPILVKTKEDTRVFTIRTDVLHSLGIPSLGVKLDAAPGRIRIVILEVRSPGIFRGSCYELCGRGHRAIPLCVIAIYSFKLKRLEAFKA